MEETLKRFNLDIVLVSTSVNTDSSSTRQDSGSGGSGYESDKHNQSEDNFHLIREKSLTCPICGVRSVLPFGGVLNLPPHYLLQHRMVLATLNASSTHLLCDICTSDISVRLYLKLNNSQLNL